MIFNYNMNEAPKDRVIEVFDPKPSGEYGPEFHNAVWSIEHNKFIGTDCDDIDPLDIQPIGWRYTEEN